MTVEQSITFGKAEIRFTVEFRRKKQLSISVHPDHRVTVTAPIGTDLGEVRKRVKKRAPWISRQLDHYTRFHPLPTPRYFVNGESHYYLGRQYRLKLIESAEENVKLQGAYLTVYTRVPKNARRVRDLVQDWYREHARAMFRKRLDAALQRTPGFKHFAPPLLIRRMKTRWGSCSKAGRILLNVELVKAPVPCIDYVIVHELCHLKVSDHSPAFYRLLSRTMPDWQLRKTRLEKIRF